MTANQIAFAQVNEGIRHNQAVEVETNRHNVAMESLAEEQNAINKEKLVLENGLGVEKNRIQEEYNKNSLALTKAQGDERLRLEAEKNSLQQQLNDITDRYNVRSSELKAMQLDIDQRNTEERIRNNQALETINMYSTMVNENVKLKELEYKEHELDVTSGLRREELNLAGLRLDTDVYFRNWESAINQQRADTLVSQVGSEINVNANKIRFMPFQAFADFAKAISPFAK